MRVLTTLLGSAMALGVSCIVLFADVWTPGIGGACSKTVGECTKEWTCTETAAPVVCYRAYETLPPDSPCQYRPKRTHGYDPVKCFYNSLSGEYGCVSAIQITPTYQWEAHPNNPINCPETPSWAAPDSSYFSFGPCPQLNDIYDVRGLLCD